MKTIRQFRIKSILTLLFVIPLSAGVIITATSCSGSKKAKTQKEISPHLSPPEPTVPIRQASRSETFTVVEHMPEYPGGDIELMKFINQNIKYPETAKKQNISGRVILRFVVGSDGIVKDPEILHGVNNELDAEALRVINLLPKWQPGLQGGKPVNVYYTIPITFSLGPSGQMKMPRFYVSGTDTIYWITTEKTMFPGGNDSLTKFRSKNLKYPEAVKSNNLGGTVQVQFVVNEDGSLSDISIISGIFPSLDAEALRVAKLMPAWMPGKENGRLIKARGSVFFVFNPPYGKGSQETNPEVFVVVEEMPRFPGGDSMLIKFINSNIQYPKNAKEKNIQGRVILRFCVTYEGKIGKVGILKGVDQELDAEAIRVIKMLPEWQPGKQGGKPVNVWYSVPVTFKLDTPPPAGINKPSEKQMTQVPLPIPKGYDEPPLFKGGESALFKFIQNNLVYPPIAKEKGITGTVIINFCITETGTVDNVAIRESSDPSLDAEALRVVKLIPVWQPGKFKGANVRVFYNLPVTFSLK